MTEPEEHGSEKWNVHSLVDGNPAEMEDDVNGCTERGWCCGP